MNQENEEINENEENPQETNESGESTILETHLLINKYLCGELTKLEKGYAEVTLTTEDEMIVDEMGLIHGGFVFGAADFAAMAAVNEKNVVLVASNCQFLAPAKKGDIVLVKAKVRQKEGRKRNVSVQAYVKNIKIFDGEFMTVITEKHVLKLKLYDEDKM
jgi:acyl-CoA thioesterase